MKARDVLAARLVNQRLVGPPLADPTAVVRHLLAVQAQDAPLARASVALRCGGTADDVRAALDAGTLVRTHVLRPTWHFVAAADARWLLELTGPKVVSGMAGRHAQLGLEPDVVEHAYATFTNALRGGAATRPELLTALRRDGVLAECSMQGQQVGHLLARAELEGLVVSGPVADGGMGVHTYALAAEVLPATEPRTREEATTEVVRRFVASHGPVSVADFQRWVKLTMAEIRAASADLPLASTSVQGSELWYLPDTLDAAQPHLRAARDATLLLPVFDEAFLSHHDVEFPRADGHPMLDAAHRFAEAGGGVVIHRLTDIGTWTRKQTARGFDLTLRLATSTPDAARAASIEAAERFAAVAAPGLPVTVTTE